MSAMPITSPTSYFPGQPGNQLDFLSSLGSYGQPLGSGAYAQTSPMIAGNGATAPVANVPSFMQPGFTSSAPAGNSFWSDLWGSAVGTTDAPGWGGLALDAAKSLGSGFMAMKQYGLAKDTLDQNRQQYERNYSAQKNMTNSRLEDRQRARVASNAGAYQSVGDYMSKNGVQ